MRLIYWILVLLGLGLPFPSIAQEVPPPLSSDASFSTTPSEEALPSEMIEARPDASLPEESEGTTPDPLEPLNRLSFHLNDRLYFWVLKPLATGYKSILPQETRLGVRNFLSNLTTPVRMANCLLQARFKEAGNEAVRFLLNSTFGLAGFFDQAKNEFKIEKTDADFGQTLGVWGVGPFFYIHWFVLGPSNVRDTIGFAGDLLLDPRTYLLSDAIFYVVRPVELVNDTSLTMGEYEEFKRAAIDPYLALREAYHQYRQNKIKGK